MKKLYILLALAALQSPAFAQGQGYDEDDEEALAAQEAAARAQVSQYGFVGTHPVPYDMGGGYCYQTAAHFHEYPPFDQYLFRESGGWFYFVGDPGDFGYAQQLWGYNGNHPIPGEYGGGYCFITWPHRHHYAPPPSMSFNFVGGYYVYGGAWDPWYWSHRDRYVGYWGGYYRNNYYGGGYWRVRPPHIYRPSLVVGAPGVYRPGVVVTPPRFGVSIGAPPARITVPPPRGGYVSPGRGYVAPPPARGGGGYVAPPPARGGGGYVAPPPARGGGGYVAPPPAHGGGGYVAPPPARGGGGYVAPPPAHGGGGYVAPPPARGGGYVAPPPARGGGYVAPAPAPHYAPAPAPARRSAPGPVNVAPPPARHR